MKFLFISRKVETRIESLKNNGKAGKNLANKVVAIIDRLKSGIDSPQIDAADNFTKYGEKRIKNCHKYDLGCGYRLVSIHRKSTIHLVFLGTHDSCQRWLENNSKLKNVNPGKGKKLFIKKGYPKYMSWEKNMSTELNSDDDLINNLTDKDLRRVFSGLVDTPGLQKS